MSTAGPAYVPRMLERRLEPLLDELPAVLIVGARAVGKTTLASRYASTIVRLDREDEATPFRIDADEALEGMAEPVLLDEWQTTPSVLGAVKRAVDHDFRPGRFIITGSVRADLEAATWPGTGRVVRLALDGMTVREQHGTSPEEPVIDRIAQHGPAALADRVLTPPRPRDYLDLVLAGGFPEALGLSEGARSAWLESYIDQVLTRDVELVDAGRDPDRLRRFVLAYATHTAQVVDDVTLIEAAGLARKTVLAYEQLLKNLFIVGSLPAWSSSRMTQLVRQPKRHVVDTGIAGTLLGVTVDSLFRDPRLLGPMLESFVVSQFRAEAGATRTRAGLFHLRSRGGRQEIDLVIELDDRRLAAVEVKAGTAPVLSDARHLAWLRDEFSDRFVAGFVLHMGPATYTLSDRIVAAPIASLWSAG